MQDYRVILDDVDGVVASTPRKQLTPSKIIPKSQQDIPVVYGVKPELPANRRPSSAQWQILRSAGGGPGAPVCVLGAAAKWSLFGASEPIDQYVKVNEQWFRVIGVASPQLSAQAEVVGRGGVRMQITSFTSR